MNHRTLLVVVGLVWGGCQAGPVTLAYDLRRTNLAALERSRSHAKTDLVRFYKHPGYIFESTDIIEHVRAQNPLRWIIFYTHVRRYLVIDPNDSRLTTFRLRTDRRHQLKYVSIAVMTPGSRPVVYLKKDLLVRKKTDGATVYKYAYPNVVKGTVVETVTMVQNKSPGNPPVTEHLVSLNSELPCKLRRVYFVFPDNWLYQRGTTPPAKDVQIQTFHRKRKKVLLYRAEDLGSFTNEPFSPHPRDDGLWFHVKLNAIHLGPVHYWSHISWESFAKKFAQFVVDNDALLSGQVGETARRLAVSGNEMSKFSRFKGIVSFIQRSIRVDKGVTKEKKDFVDVLRTRRGSALAITGLTRLMLSKAGFESEYVLINPAQHGIFDKYFVTTNTFILPAVMTRVGGRRHMVIPYIKQLPIGLIPPMLQGRPAMAIGVDGFKSFFTTPVLDARKNRAKEIFHVQLNPDGQIQVREQKRFYGLRGFLVRKHLGKSKPSERTKKSQEMITFTEGDFRFSSTRIRNFSEPDKPLIIDYEYTIDNLLTVTESEVLLQTAGLFAPSWRAKALSPDRDRGRPVQIHSNAMYEREVNIKYPHRWSLETRITSGSQTNVFGVMITRYDTSIPGLIRAKQQLTLKRTRQPPGQIRELANLMGRIGKGTVPSLVFRVGGQPPADEPGP